MQLDEEIMKHVILLPKELKEQVLDFVLFLEQRQNRQAQENVLDYSEQEMAHIFADVAKLP